MDVNIGLFFSSVLLNVDTGCLEWQKQVNKKGYGRVNVRGKVWLAHRVSYYMCFNHDPGHLCVLHHCDNPKCVNPDHLFLGTKSDNNADMRRKGRAAYQIGTSRHVKGDQHGRRTQPNAFPRGEQIHNAKIKDTQVVYIRNQFLTGLKTIRQLSNEFSVCFSTIHNIVNNKTYIHVK